MELFSIRIQRTFQLVSTLVGFVLATNPTVMPLLFLLFRHHTPLLYQQFFSFIGKTIFLPGMFRIFRVNRLYQILPYGWIQI